MSSSGAFSSKLETEVSFPEYLAHAVRLPYLELGPWPTNLLIQSSG